jgi:hypothetical protein
MALHSCFLLAVSHKITIFVTKFRRNMDSAAQKIASSIEAIGKGKIFLGLLDGSVPDIPLQKNDVLFIPSRQDYVTE